MVQKKSAHNIGDNKNTDHSAVTINEKIFARRLAFFDEEIMPKPTRHEMLSVKAKQKHFVTEVISF